MKKFVINGIWKLVCAFVLCAGITILLMTCSKDDECEECTFKVGGVVTKTETLCGDDLTEAKLLPGVTCK